MKTAAIIAAVVNHFATAARTYVRNTADCTYATRGSHVLAVTMMMITAETIIKTGVHFQVCIIIFSLLLFMCR